MGKIISLAIITKNADDDFETWFLDLDENDPELNAFFNKHILEGCSIRGSWNDNVNEINECLDVTETHLTEVELM